MSAHSMLSKQFDTHSAKDLSGSGLTYRTELSSVSVSVCMILFFGCESELMM